MSVINDMLKDLERRQYQQPVTVNGNSMHELRTVTPAIGSKTALGLTIGTLALTCCVWIAWQLSGESSSSLISIPLSLPPEQIKTIEMPEMVTSQMVDITSSRKEGQVQAIDDTLAEVELDINRASNSPDTLTEAEMSVAGGAPVSLPSVLERKPQIELPPARPVALKKPKHGYVAAERALKRGQTSKAEQLLKIILVEEPDHLPASILLSRLYLESNRLELAEKCAQSALQHHPQQAELVTYLVRSLMVRGHLDEASVYLERNLHEQHAPHLGLMGVIRQRQEKHADASRYYRRALQLLPDEVTWLTGLGISQEYLGETEAAMAVYRHSLTVGGLNAALREFVTARIKILNGYE